MKFRNNCNYLLINIYLYVSYFTMEMRKGRWVQILMRKNKLVVFKAFPDQARCCVPQTTAVEMD